jgi:hypothetical protein
MRWQYSVQTPHEYESRKKRAIIPFFFLFFCFSVKYLLTHTLKSIIHITQKERRKDEETLTVCCQFHRCLEFFWWKFEARYFEGTVKQIYMDRCQIAYF